MFNASEHKEMDSSNVDPSLCSLGFVIDTDMILLEVLFFPLLVC